MPDATALLVLWNGVTPALDADYNTWHAQEHVPERLTVPGMLWARRYAAGWPQPGPRYLTLYGLRDLQVLDSAPYRRPLEHPTPASTRMRSHLCQLSRWICTLSAPQPAPAGQGLRVRCGDRRPRPDAAGALLAERVADAAPLPWLQSGQDHAVTGRWLLATPLPARPLAAEPGAMVYAALPVGRAEPQGGGAC